MCGSAVSMNCSCELYNTTFHPYQNIAYCSFRNSASCTAYSRGKAQWHTYIITGLTVLPPTYNPSLIPSPALQRSWREGTLKPQVELLGGRHRRFLVAIANSCCKAPIMINLFNIPASPLGILERKHPQPQTEPYSPPPAPTSLDSSSAASMPPCTPPPPLVSPGHPMLCAPQPTTPLAGPSWLLAAPWPSSLLIKLLARRAAS